MKALNHFKTCEFLVELRKEQSPWKTIRTSQIIYYIYPLEVMFVCSSSTSIQRMNSYGDL